MCSWTLCRWAWHYTKWQIYSQLLITQTFKGNRKRFEILGVRVTRSWEQMTRDGEGMQVPCTLHFKGHKKFINILEKELSGTELELDWHIFCNVKKDRIHGCFKIYLMFWTTVLRSFWLVTCWQTWFELSRVKLYRKWPEGKRKLLRVRGRFELLRVWVAEGKITVNVWRKSRGNRLWFELARGSS